MSTAWCVTAPRYRGRTATYVQAWTCTGPKFSGIVYAESVALDKLADGCDIESLTIVRHDDGTREMLPGAMANCVFTYRETGSES